MRKIIFLFFLSYYFAFAEKYIVIRIADNNSVNRSLSNLIPDLGFSAVTLPPGSPATEGENDGNNEGKNEGTNEGENEELDDGENEGLSGVVKKNNEIGIIESWGPHFRVSFEMKIKSFVAAKWTNILSFKGNGAKESCCQPGDRAPAIFLQNNKKYLVFSHPVNGNGKYSSHWDKKVKLNKWYKIIIEQISINGKVVALVKKKTCRLNSS